MKLGPPAFSHAALLATIALLASALMLGAPPMGVGICLLGAVTVSVWRLPRPAVQPAVTQGVAKKTQSDLEEEYARASFLAKVSHELRTPLHNIQGLIRVLYRNETNAAHRYYLRLLQDASKNLLSTINDVLDFSKANTGMLSVERKPCELLSVVRDALRSVASRADDKPNLELLCSYDTTVPKVIHSDPQRIRQILVNLLGNAIKFTNSGFVRLDVEALTLGDGKQVVRFSVADTGIGIPAEKLRSVFEPFSQVDITVVRRTQGTGLGLTISQQLVELLRGEIGVESTLGQGSTFWFTISAKADQHASPPGSTRSGGSVHIVSRSTHTVALLKDALLEQGFDVNCSQHPPTTEQLRQSPNDFLVVTDDVLVEEGTWRLISDFIEHRGPQAVLPLLGPGAIRFRQRCNDLGLPVVLPLPLVSKDLIDALCGCYQSEEPEDELLQTVAATEPLNILIADDIPTNELILRLALEEAGHNVRAVNDGRELWNVVRPQIERPGEISPRELFDVVLTDIQMPHMDGITVIRKVRELEAQSAKCGAAPLPLIAVTAHAFAAEQERILSAGATGIVTKPLNPKELERVLSTVRRRSERCDTPRIPDAERAPLEVSYSDSDSEETPSRETSPFVAEMARIMGSDVEFIDVEGLFERSGESSRRTILILRSFLGCYQELLTQLENDADSLSTEELGKLAHAIKGLAGEVGAKSLHKLAHALEKFGKGDRREDLMRGVPELISEIKQAAAIVWRIVQAFDGSGERIAVDSHPPA